MTRFSIALAVSLALASQGSCSDLMDDSGDEEARIPIDEDMRVYARRARAKLADLTPARRKVVEPALVAHERAIARYDRLLAKGETRRAVLTPLVSAGVYVAANDVTAVGVADDIALPFLALGALGVALVTSAPSSPQVLHDAYKEVMDTGQVVSKVIQSAQIDDADEASSSSTSTASQTEEEARGRQKCIDYYVDCQQNSVRSFDRRKCQGCMDWCLAQGYKWPQEKACDYLQKRRKRRIRPKLRPLKPKIQI